MDGCGVLTALIVVIVVVMIVIVFVVLMVMVVIVILVALCGWLKGRTIGRRGSPRTTTFTLDFIIKQTSVDPSQEFGISSVTIVDTSGSQKEQKIDVSKERDESGGKNGKSITP